MSSNILNNHRYGTSVYRDAVRQMDAENVTSTARPPVAPRSTPQFLDNSVPMSQPGMPRMASSAASRSPDGFVAQDANVPPVAARNAVPDFIPGTPPEEQQRRQNMAPPLAANASIPLDMLANVVDLLAARMTPAATPPQTVENAQHKHTARVLSLLKSIHFRKWSADDMFFVSQLRM